MIPIKFARLYTAGVIIAFIILNILIFYLYKKSDNSLLNIITDDKISFVSILIFYCGIFYVNIYTIRQVNTALQSYINALNTIVKDDFELKKEKKIYRRNHIILLINLLLMILLLITPLIIYLNNKLDLFYGYKKKEYKSI